MKSIFTINRATFNITLNEPIENKNILWQQLLGKCNLYIWQIKKIVKQGEFDYLVKLYHFQTNEIVGVWLSI